MSFKNKLKFYLPDGGWIEMYTKFRKLSISEGIWEDLNYRDTYDINGKLVYRLTNGWWVKKKYDERGRMIFYENSHGLSKRLTFHYTENGCVREVMETL